MLRVLLNKDLLVYEENNEMILINMVKNNFYALDYMGTVIWKKMVNCEDVKKVIEYVCSEFNAEYQEVEEDTLNFIFELKKVGVIKIA
ncbi:PqqD family protein [Bacillus cereus]|uniref:PqqD family protein n=1 Tax=Bacillus TaxID=1386 RepID=UPI0027D2F36B|nr:PqqD family protein [Bacillus cereus]MCU5061347.1 PqqD family protein [Bacillus cereus]MCU5145520.1 PqqD family protein [Bacillus cereus]